MHKLSILALAALLPLAACGKDEHAPAPATAGTPAAPAPANTALGRKIQAAMAEASEKLATENMRVGKESGEPEANISPQADLLADGKPVPSDAAQRKLLLAHRANLVAVAQAGIAVGMQGADLGIEAATGALKSVFRGESEKFGQEMEARGKAIEAEAMKLCERMPPLLVSQQALVAALPAFKPYATIDQQDIDDCGKDGHYNVDVGNGSHATAEVEAGSQGNDHRQNSDAAAEADAAAKEAAAPAPPPGSASINGVKFVFPDGGDFSVQQETSTTIVAGITAGKGGATTLRTGQTTIVVTGGTMQVNGTSMPLPKPGSTIRVHGTGRVEVI